MALLLAVTACSATPAATSQRSATPSAQAQASPRATSSPAPGLYAVIVTDFLQGVGTYTVSLVDTNGTIAAIASPRKRSQFSQIGNLSTSRTTLYYLDGDSDIRYLRPDRSTGLATSITVSAHQVVAFAVSPDDRRIAVSILDYTKYPVSTRLFVEDLAGHQNHMELFSSPSVLEWPAGWHSGRLVMALGVEAPPQNAYEGFMRGHGYHVADATTGNRLLSLCDGGDSSVPETPAGTVCVQYPKASIVSWDGGVQPVASVGSCALWGPLSPAGVMASRITADSGGNCLTGPDVYLFSSSGIMGAMPTSLAHNASPEGWLDPNFLVVRADASPSGLSIVDTRVGALSASPVDGQGFFAAAVPGGL